MIHGAMTISALAIQNAEEKSKIEAEIRSIVEKGDEKKWIDEEKGVFECPHKVALAVASVKER